MERQEVQNKLSCTMCFFQCDLNDELIYHYIRYHKYDPQFIVQCNFPGCGATYRKWKSFKQHVRRQQHSDTEIFDQDQHLLEERDLQNDIQMNQENFDEENNNEGEI